MTLRLRQGVAMQKLTDTAVLLDVQAGIYFELNASGVVALEAMLAGADSRGAAQALSSRFDIDPDNAQKDCLSLLQALRDASLLELG